MQVLPLRILRRDYVVTAYQGIDEPFFCLVLWVVSGNSHVQRDIRVDNDELATCRRPQIDVENAGEIVFVRNSIDGSLVVTVARE